jgi:hypothetical protein
MENPSPYSAARKMICRLPDVSSCEIQVAEGGAIDAVHVTALPGRSPKQIARDVEAILAAEEGVFVDHRKISIAQYGESKTASRPALGRICLDGVTKHQRGSEVEVEVTLRAGVIPATGRAVGSNTRFEIRRIVAQATLDGIAKLVDGDPSLSLGELDETDLGAKRVILVCVNQTLGRTETHLMGCCEVGYDSTQAVIYGVLDAVNRLVSTWKPREPVEFEIGPASADS